MVATSASYPEQSGGRTHRELCALFVRELNKELSLIVGGGVVGMESRGDQEDKEDKEGKEDTEGKEDKEDTEGKGREAGVVDDDGNDWEVQALDITRSIDGQPFTVGELASIVGCPPSHIASFSCPEKSSVRYKQSVAARVVLHPANRPASTNASDVSTCAAEGGLEHHNPPASFFYKRAVLRELPYALHKAVQYPYKILRDVKANRTEAIFLSSDLPRAFCAASERGVRVALPYRVEEASYLDTPIDSRFALCLYDFSPRLGWRQHPHLKATPLGAALGALAEWHAFFWLAHDPEGAKAELAARMWDAGSYWHLGQQPAGTLAKLKPNWKRLFAAFQGANMDNGEDSGEDSGEDNGEDRGAGMRKGVGMERYGDDLGARLERVALRASEEAHGLDASHVKIADGSWVNAAYETIIHGDPKAPNIFMQDEAGKADDAAGAQGAKGANDAGAEGVCGSGEGGGGESRDGGKVGLIDEQWTGRGLGAVDVAYCIAASADPSVFTRAAGNGNDGDLLDSLADSPACKVAQRLIGDYHTHLLRAFVACGAAADQDAAAALLPAEVFQVQFEWAWIDLTRCVVGDQWGSITPDVLKGRRGQMNFNAYNKAIEMAGVLLEVADVYLRRREGT